MSGNLKMIPNKSPKEENAGDKKSVRIKKS